MCCWHFPVGSRSDCQPSEVVSSRKCLKFQLWRIVWTAYYTELIIVKEVYLSSQEMYNSLAEVVVRLSLDLDLCKSMGEVTTAKLDQDLSWQPLAKKPNIFMRAPGVILTDQA
jgi:hypothetical protein